MWCKLDVFYDVARQSHHVPHEKISTPLLLLPWFTSTTLWHQVGSKVHRQWLENPAGLQKDQVVASHFIDVHSLMALTYGPYLIWPGDQGFPSTRLFKLMMRTRVWIFKFLRGHLLVAGVFLEKEGIGVALLLKGVTKAPSCMRNVLGNLMTPDILFVALEWRKYDSNISSRCMTSKSECSTCVSSNEFNDQHEHVRWVEHRAQC